MLAVRMYYYIFVGDETNWKVSLKKKVWGCTSSLYSTYSRINSGDVVAFYVKKPYMSIIGFGRIHGKAENTELIWPLEVKSNTSIWRYKMYFDLLHVVDNWGKGIKSHPPIGRRGIQQIRNEKIFQDLVSKADSSWKTDIYSEIWGKSVLD